MGRKWCLFLTVTAVILATLCLSGPTGSAGQTTPGPYLIAASDRFVDNGDGTVTDTRRKLMWQQGDNGVQVKFREAREYCRTLRLGGYTDWRLPEPLEVDTNVAVALMMPRHAGDIYSNFDLYWSSDPTVLLPFNYRPAQGREISRTYPADDGKAFVRAVRSATGVRLGRIL